MRCASPARFNIMWVRCTTMASTKFSTPTPFRSGGGCQIVRTLNKTLTHRRIDCGHTVYTHTIEHVTCTRTCTCICLCTHQYTQSMSVLPRIMHDSCCLCVCVCVCVCVCFEATGHDSWMHTKTVSGFGLISAHHVDRKIELAVLHNTVALRSFWAKRTIIPQNSCQSVRARKCAREHIENKTCKRLEWERHAIIYFA